MILMQSKKVNEIFKNAGATAPGKITGDVHHRKLKMEVKEMDLTIY